MKRGLLFTFLLLMIHGLSFGQAQRKAFVEEFTNASCGPCASQNPDFNALIANNLDKVVVLKYQTDFPGYDPMNEQNPSEVDTRQAYYSVNGVPTAIIDGVTPGNDYGGGIGAWNITATNGYAGGPYGYNQAVYDYASSQMTPIELHLDHNLSADLSMVTIDIKIKNVSASAFSMTSGKLHVAMTETLITFPSAPGSNGEKVFSDIMRKMYPNQNGTDIGMIAAGDSLEIQLTEAVPSYIYDYTKIGVIAFVQDDADKVVWQSERSEPKAIVGDFPDVALDVTTVEPTALCGATVTPSMNVSNTGAVEVTSFDVSYSLNGGAPVVEAWTGSLMPGADVGVAFSEIVLPSGTATVDYAISNINGGVQELNTLNNITPQGTFSSLSEVATSSELVEDNEDYDFGFPEGAVVDVPINSFVVVRRSDLSNNAGDPIGGYGNSNKSIWVNFYQWNPANVNGSGTLTYDKIDLSDAQNSRLIYDRASAGYSNGDVDRLQVLVSTDCGDNWTIVQDLTGTNLTTGGNVDPFFMPTSSQWATDTIDLSAYDGNAGVHIQFKAISAWGNSLYLDNINLAAGPVATNNPNLLAGKVKVFPNPTANQANIEFELVENTNVDIRVYDMTGKLVTVLEQDVDMSAGKHIRVWKGAKETGVYLVKIRTNQGELSQRLTVIK